MVKCDSYDDCLFVASIGINIYSMTKQATNKPVIKLKYGKIFCLEDKKLAFFKCIYNYHSHLSGSILTNTWIAKRQKEPMYYCYSLKVAFYNIILFEMMHCNEKC